MRHAIRKALWLALLAVGCGGDAEPPKKVTCVAIDFSGFCDNSGCERDVRCDGVPDFGEGVTCKLKTAPDVWRCKC
jgi:hypothetical protein